MIKIAKRLQMLYIIICVILCIGVLTGCQSKKYDTIELPGQETEVSGETEETETVSEEGTDGLQENTPAPAALSMEESGAEEATASSDSMDRRLTMSDGFYDVDDTVTINTDLVNIRTECSEDSRIMAQLNTGDTLQRTGYSDAWTRVLYMGEVCYVASQFVTEESGEGVTAAAAETVSSPESTEAAPKGKVIAIDPGHQAKGNSEKEPIGPGAETMKEKVAAGATGVSSGLKEYELTLEVSKKLRTELEARGYEVVMIRESHDVNLSNAERAKIANESGASVFVRIHGNSLDNGSVSGALTMCQTAGNPYNGELHSASYSLSKHIVDGICAMTGTRNRGVQETDSMSGINWCQIPVSIVEMGFMSNPAEDANMADEAYQEKLAQGIANGIDAYFGY